MKKARGLWLVLFAWTMLGADDCALTQIGQPVPPPPPASDKPFCQFDPPVGCKAICIGVGEIGFTSQCDDISASTLTVQFKNTVGGLVIQAMMSSQTFCTQDDIDDNFTVTPCLAGITPRPNPPESQDVCMNPLPGCVQW